MAINFFHLPAVLPSQEESPSSSPLDSVKATKVPNEDCTLPCKEWSNPKDISNECKSSKNKPSAVNISILQPPVDELPAQSALIIAPNDC